MADSGIVTKATLSQSGKGKRMRKRKWERGSEGRWRGREGIMPPWSEIRINRYDNRYNVDVRSAIRPYDLNREALNYLGRDKNVTTTEFWVQHVRKKEANRPAAGNAQWDEGPRFSDKGCCETRLYTFTRKRPNSNRKAANQSVEKAALIRRTRYDDYF